MVFSYKWINYNQPNTSLNHQTDSAAHPIILSDTSGHIPILYHLIQSLIVEYYLSMVSTNGMLESDEKAKSKVWLQQ